MLVSATAVNVAAASEEARTKARGLADEAANSYARGDYAQAEVLLDRAYALVPAPTVALLRARTLVRLNKWVEAMRVYTSASNAKLDPAAPEAFRNAARDAKLELAALEPRVPRLRIDVAKSLLARPSLVVRLDGAVVPRARLAGFIAADPGVHPLKVEADAQLVRAFDVSLRERERLVVPVDEARPARAGSKRTWGVVAVAAGGAVFGLGVVAGVVALDAHSDVERDCPDRRCAAGGSGAEALEKFETYRTLSTIGYVVGAAGIGVGSVVLLTSSNAEPRLVATPSVDGVRIRGSW